MKKDIERIEKRESSRAPDWIDRARYRYTEDLGLSFLESLELSSIELRSEIDFQNHEYFLPGKKDFDGAIREIKNVCGQLPAFFIWKDENAPGFLLDTTEAVALAAVMTSFNYIPEIKEPHRMQYEIGIRKFILVVQEILREMEENYIDLAERIDPYHIFDFEILHGIRVTDFPVEVSDILVNGPQVEGYLEARERFVTALDAQTGWIVPKEE